MTLEPDNDLDGHLDRLMETAYEALRAGDARGGGCDAAEEEVRDRVGPYAVTGVLGRGGTSVVYRGSDPTLGREIAIKVIHRRHAADGGLTQRFLDEARICSQLPHPGIVPIYGVGQIDDGRPYITMRLVEGETLHALLAMRTHPADRLQQFLETFARVCETVAFAHARGVVHGDLKPGNVMVGAFGQVQVMDWGFSRLVGLSAPGEPPRGMGTPAFMAPEQAAGDVAVDARTDVFGLGAILCVILTGSPPFRGGSRSEAHVRAIGAALGDAFARLRDCGADRELAALAADCLQHAPAARPSDAAAVATRVAAWMASAKERAHQLELAAAQTRAKASEQRRTRRRTLALAAIGVAFAGIYAWMRFERQAHDYEARVAVVQAIERARNLRAGADIAGDERMRWLGEAAQAAQQAKAFAATIGDADLRADAEWLSRELDADREAAARDEAMLAWLDDFPAHLDLTRDQLDLEFANAFRRYGVDVAGLSDDDVVARLRESPIAVALSRALDDWGFVRRAQPAVAPTVWRRFHELALRVDVDPLRSAVRRALLAGDREALLGLADDERFGNAPTDSLDLLGTCLSHGGDPRTAARVWQRANERQPDNVRVIHSLAVQWFVDAVCPPWDEVVRLFGAGTALRPRNAHLWADLGHALIGQGNVAAAENAMRRALECEPGDERAIAGLADLLRCLGDPAGAHAVTRTLAERAGTAGAWRLHADALHADGFVVEAADASREALTRDDSAVHHERLGQCLLDLGDLDGALRSFRSAEARAPHRASVHVHMGLALRLQGDFTGALTALARGRAAGDAALAARCDAWIAATEQLVAARRSFEAGAESRAVPTVDLALAAHLAGRSRDGAESFREVFAHDPGAAAGELVGWNLERAAHAALLAAADGAAGEEVDAGTRAAWRDQAVTWLSDAVARVLRAHAMGTLPPAAVRRRIALWRHSPAYLPVREEMEPQLAALEASLVGEPRVTVHAPFDRHVEFRWLGGAPGVPRPYGGLLLDAADPDELVVAGHAQRRTASLFAVPLRRGPGGHVDGLAGKARHLVAAPFADGGVARGPRGILCYTRFPAAEIGIVRRGARGPDRVVGLPGASAGGLAFVPPGLPGAGRVKVLTWPAGGWLDVSATDDAGKFALGEPRHVRTLPGGADGFAYVAAGGPPFERPTVLVAEWSAHAIVAYDVDANGDPIEETRRPIVSGCRGVLGLAVDPVTGDVLVSSWRGDGTEQIGLLRRTDR